MSVDLKKAFRLSFVTGEAALPIAPVPEILARLRSGPVWDGASIAPVDDPFLLLHVEWHEGHGFVIQCHKDEHAWSDFLLTGARCGPPTIEINLGGQTLERWPSELFVPQELAHQALDCFLTKGKQDPECCVGSESTPFLATVALRRAAHFGRWTDEAITLSEGDRTRHGFRSKTS